VNLKKKNHNNKMFKFKQKKKNLIIFYLQFPFKNLILLLRLLIKSFNLATETTYPFLEHIEIINDNSNE